MNKMNSRENSRQVLYGDIAQEQADLAESRMLEFLLESVQRRKTMRAFRRIGSVSVVIACSLVTTLLFDRSDVRQNVFLSDPDTEVSYLLDLVSPVEYFTVVPTIEFIQTSTITVNHVNDTELEEIFPDRAFAIASDMVTKQRTFHFLDAHSEANTF